MKLKALVQIRIQGLNQEQIFNKLNKLNIKIFELKRINYQDTVFSVKKEDYKQVINILNENNVNIIRNENQGLLKLTEFLKCRFGILIGLGISIFFVLLFNNFILSIDVIGNESLTKSEIIKYLDQQNINTFTLKNEIDTKQIEHNLILNFEEISLVSVVTKGNALIIKVKEKINSNNQEAYSNLVADFDGRISKIDLISGTANVKIGDLVKKGDILVYGYCYDSSGTQMSIEAKADIYAEVWLETSIIHNEDQTNIVETGRQVCYQDIALLGVNILKKQHIISFEKYNIEVTEKKLNGLLLPLKITFTTYKEQQISHKFEKFEDVKQKLIDECKEKTLQKILESDIIKKESSSITSLENGVNLVSYVIAVERKCI